MILALGWADWFVHRPLVRVTWEPVNRAAMEDSGQTPPQDDYSFGIVYFRTLG